MTLADPISVVHTPALGTQAHGGEGGSVQPEGTPEKLRVILNIRAHGLK